MSTAPGPGISAARTAGSNNADTEREIDKYVPAREAIPKFVEKADARPISGSSQQEQYPTITHEHMILFRPIASKAEEYPGYLGRPKNLKFPVRSGYERPDHYVLTNHFNIRLDPTKDGKKHKHILYVYRFDNIAPGHTNAKKRALVKAAIEACPGLRNSRRYWATDNTSKIVSWCNPWELDPRIIRDPDSGVVVISIPVQDFDRRYHTTSTLNLDLVFERKIHLADLIKYVNGRYHNYPHLQEAIAVMNLVLGKHPFATDQANIAVGDGCFFPQRGWEDIDSPGKLVYRGYSFQVRPAMGQLMLNINTTAKLFYDNITVAAFLRQNENPEQLCGVRVWLTLKRNVSDNVIDIDQDHHRTKTISEMGRIASLQEAYPLTGNGEERPVMVWEHMQQRYTSHKNIDYNTRGSRQSLCVNTNPKDASTEAWFLAEDLIILPGQICKHKPGEQLTSSLIKFGSRAPSINARAITTEGLATMGIVLNLPKDEGPQVFPDLGINVDPRMLKVPARTVEVPQLHVRAMSPTSGQLESKSVSTDGALRGTWQLDPQWRFLSAAQPRIGQPFFLIPPRFSKTMLRQFWKYYTHHGAPALGSVPQYFNNTNSRTIERKTQIGNAVEAATKAKPSIVIMILPDDTRKSQSHYALFKALCDQTYGLPSLCVNATKLRDLMEQSRPHYDATSPIANYAYNVGMKLNIRFGGTNHSIAPSNFASIPTTSSGKHGTLILGASVTHPDCSNVKGTPSIAALVGSVDNKYAKYCGSMRKQAHDPESMSKDIIDNANMRSMVTERLQAWAKFDNRWPAYILYYRDGVSESQFDAVLSHEVAMIRLAYEDLAPGLKPKITAIVVNKRHNIRLYPSSAAHTSDTGNCPPGTIVDSSITHPYYFDWYNIPHDAAQGTARPTHYTVLLNEMGFDATSIQNLTHILCYTYQRSTSSVSCVPAVYYAQLLCERGRCYLLDFYDGADWTKKKDVDVGVRLIRLGREVGEVVGIRGIRTWMRRCFGCEGMHWGCRMEERHGDVVMLAV